MKKIFTLVLLFCSLQSFGQLTLVKELNKRLETFVLSDNKWIHFEKTFQNDRLNGITLFNEDYSVKKVVKIDQKFPHDTVGFKYNYIGLSEINRIDGSENEFEATDKFFNLDEKLEFIISYSSQKYIDGKRVSISTDILIDEDGKEIFRFVNNNGDWTNYFFSKYLMVFLGSEENRSLCTTKIYSVPGNLPCSSSCSQKAASIAPITQPNEFKEIQVTGFPNPSSEKVTLAYALPEGTKFGTLRLYTQTGELVKEFKVSNQVDHLELPVSEYNSGTYFYELQAGGSSSGGKKMVVIH